ncbi:hypothetical protein POPTR_012G009345v4 [Populus trichocarpa]|uniref:Uncharacterized protein n=1 Tax=Populus trichocarpa TaxID=3694 RepID=A0ACC0S3N4_POPTR|nr:hypothetical protein POPTR_012G009345v4 [Populus trichocarpa]
MGAETVVRVATYGAWVKPEQTSGSDSTSSPLPSYTGSEEQHHLQRRKRCNPVGFSFSSWSRIYFFFSLFWICFVLGFAFFSASLFSAGCSSGRRFSVGNGAASVGAAGGRRTAVGR